MPPPALSVESLCKVFRVPHAPGDTDPRRQPDGRRDRFHALREVAFTVEAGQTLGIVGANGSGKSTLLKILSGVMTPTSGRFVAQGRIGALLELGAGFHPDLTGVENIYLNGAVLGLQTRQIDRLLPEIIAFAELERFMDMPVKHYSSGMTARLGFAVATRLAPEILLMDETFATGDARFQARALGHVAQMKQEGRTLVLVSHSLEMIMHLADRVLWLDAGQVRAQGDPAEIVSVYQRSQQMSLHQIGQLRTALGMDSLFPSLEPGRAPVRLGAVHLRGDEGGANPAGAIRTEYGRPVHLALSLEHDAGHPPAVRVETAWVRGDHRIIAQSCTPVALSAGAGATRLTLHFDPWPLTQGEYRLAVAVGPAGGGATPSGAQHFDRRLDAGTVHVVTPNTAELPVLTHLAARWSAGEPG